MGSRHWTAVLAGLALTGLLSAVPCLAGCSPGTSARVLGKSNVSRIPVLEYHGISRRPLNAHNAPYDVDLRAFAAQLAYLRSQGYRSITPGQYVRWLYDEPVTLPRKPILITFDDGRADSALALPALRRFHYRAVMFVVTAFAALGTAGNPAWESWSQLRHDGWYLEFHAGPLGHLTWRHPYYARCPLTACEKDIRTGLDELAAMTGVHAQTWAVPNGAWTAPLARWAATRFRVIWLEGSMAPAAAAGRFHMRYRAEIANGPMEKVSYLQAALGDPRFQRLDGFTGR